MALRLAALRTQVESALAGRVPAPFTYRDRQIVETVPTRIPEVDGLTGGLPRGSLTEVCGPSSSGRTSLLLAALASRTAQAEVCALVDGRDGFDPQSAEAAGVELDRLLWVRCHNIEQSLRATDLLLQSGGFGLIALDLSDIPAQTVRYVPLNVWFRFRRTVEDTPTILLVLEQESNARTCASLVLRLDAGTSKWGTLPPKTQHTETLSFARLLEGSRIFLEKLRSRRQAFTAMTKSSGSEDPGYNLRLKLQPPEIRQPPSDATHFATRTIWSHTIHPSTGSLSANSPTEPATGQDRWFVDEARWAEPHHATQEIQDHRQSFLQERFDQPRFLQEG